jgi:hypothetical protein
MTLVLVAPVRHAAGHRFLDPVHLEISMSERTVALFSAAMLAALALATGPAAAGVDPPDPQTTLKFIGTGKCLGAGPSSGKSHRGVLGACTKDPNHLWTMPSGRCPARERGPGGLTVMPNCDGPDDIPAFIIRNVGTGQCLDIEGQSLRKGARADLAPCKEKHPTPPAKGSQYWYVSFEKGRLTFKNTRSGLCLGQAEKSPANDTEIIQKKCAPGARQEWDAQ